MKVSRRPSKHPHRSHADDAPCDRIIEIPLYRPGKPALYKGAPAVIQRVVLRQCELWIRLEGSSRDVRASEVHIKPTPLRVERQTYPPLQPA
jgi:hypothetical protein